MKIDIEGLTNLGTRAKAVENVRGEIDKMRSRLKEEEGRLEKLASDSKLKLDDPRIEDASRWLRIIPARLRAAEAEEKVSRRELAAAYAEAQRAVDRVLTALLDARLAKFEATNLQFFHAGSRKLERMVKEHGRSSDFVGEVREAILSVGCWSGPGVEARICEEVQRFARNAKSVAEKFGKEIDALPEPMEKAPAPKTRRIRIEKLVTDRSDDSERQRMVNVAVPVQMANGERFEPGKTYSVDEGTYAALKTMTGVVDVGLLEQAGEAVKTAVVSVVSGKK